MENLLYDFCMSRARKFLCSGEVGQLFGSCALLCVSWAANGNLEPCMAWGVHRGPVSVGLLGPGLQLRVGSCVGTSQVDGQSALYPGGAGLCGWSQGRDRQYRYVLTSVTTNAVHLMKPIE